MTKITSGVYGDGSYGGHRAKTPGGPVRIWFCGRGYTERNGYYQDTCSHATRDDARRCTRVVGPKGTLADPWC